MRRQAQYLYVAELMAGARVVEVPCGTGDGARFLAEHGAAHVIGVDPSAEAIASARREHRLTNLELRCEDPRALELDDASVDCVVVPDGAAVIRRRTVLDELRRVLKPEGSLIVAARSADRGGGAGGVSYHELVDRLGPLFAPVAMVAQTPVSGWALVGYSDEPSRAVDGVVVDRTLLREHTEVSDYLAICGGAELETGAFTIFQEPPRTLAEGDVGVELAAVVPLDARVTGTFPAAGVPIEERATVELPAYVDGEADDDAIEAIEEVVVEDDAVEDDAVEDDAVEDDAVEDDAVEDDAVEDSDDDAARDEELRAALDEAESLRAALTAAEQRNRELVIQLDQVRERAVRAEERLEEIDEEMEERIARAASDAASEQALEDSDQLEAALTREEERRAGLERSLEEAENARAQLEAKVSEAEAAADEMRSALFDVDPARAARVETSVRERVAMTMKARRIEDEIGTARELLAQLTRSIAELADAHLESGGAADDEQLRQMAIEIGVKDAELTLLNIGVGSLQGRLSKVVDRVRETREQMLGRSAPEMLAIMEALEDALTVES